ncbi:MAG: hypothetical protein ACYC6Y_18150 [Thermoguttaceae bacterium]
MTRTAVLIALIVTVSLDLSAHAATVLFCPMDSLDGWTVRCHGTADAAVVANSRSARCLQASARNGTVFLTRELPLDEVRGCRVEIGCLARCRGLLPGVQSTSTAKIHLAVLTPQGPIQNSVRLADSESSQFRGLAADVPKTAQRVLLNLGLEACSGTVEFDQLVVRTDRRVAVPLDLSRAANAGHEQLGIPAIPKGTLVCDDIPFAVLDGAQNDGADCIRLKGTDHPDWPERISPPIPVGRTASAIYILHATLTQPHEAETPCAMWNAWFSEGHSAGLSLFEGREIGSIRAAADLENWKIAWRDQAAGRPALSFGVTRWPIHIDSPILHLSARSYQGAAPVILAITVVEEPPAPKRQVDDSEVEE